jgi:hypothetical protein
MAPQPLLQQALPGAQSASRRQRLAQSTSAKSGGGGTGHTPLCGAGAAAMTTSSCTGPPMFSTTGSALRGAAARIGAGAAARCGAGAALLAASKESIHRPASGGGGFAAAAATGSAAGGGDAATRGSGDAVGSTVGGGGTSCARAGGGDRATGGGGDAGVTAQVPLGCFTFRANPQMLAVCAATTERFFGLASQDGPRPGRCARVQAHRWQRCFGEAAGRGHEAAHGGEHGVVAQAPVSGVAMRLASVVRDTQRYRSMACACALGATLGAQCIAERPQRITALRHRRRCRPAQRRQRCADVRRRGAGGQRAQRALAGRQQSESSRDAGKRIGAVRDARCKQHQQQAARAPRPRRRHASRRGCDCGE